MDEQYEFIAPDEGEAGRLDQFVPRSVEGMTRSTVQRLIDEGRVTVDGKVEKPSLKLRGGEHIVVAVPPPTPAVPVAEEIPLAILHEDSDLVVVNKPAGMVVHQFREHTIKRIYLALVFGSPKTDTGRIEGAIGRHPTDRKRMSGKAKHGKHAVTHWKVLARYPGMTLLRLRLETGRTHQIRVHLAEAGHPLVGDEVYGGAGRANDLKDPVLKKLVRELGRQALHAKTLGFIHPAGGTYVEFDTELPEDMARIITYLEQQGA
jgi:23S rRNA pseudouridine1911/1915/1917 synthase